MPDDKEVNVFDIGSIVEDGRTILDEPSAANIDQEGNPVVEEKVISDEEGSAPPKAAVEASPAPKARPSAGKLSVIKSSEAAKPPQGAELPESVENDESEKVNEDEQPASLPKKRDYSQFTPEEQEVLKLVGNKAFAKLSERFLRDKSAPREGAVKAWYDSPEAYVLSKDYKEHSAIAQDATLVQNHWAKQLANIDEGRGWRPLNRDAQGNLVVGPEQQVTPEIKYQILAAMQEAGAMAQQSREKLNSLATSFAQPYKQAEIEFNKMAEAGFNNLLPELKPQDAHVQQYLNAIPAVYRDHPRSIIEGKMYSVLVNQANKIGQLEAKLKAAIASTNQVEQRLGGPKPKAGKTTTSKQEKVFDLDEIEGQ